MSARARAARTSVGVLLVAGVFAACAAAETDEPDPVKLPDRVAGADAGSEASSSDGATGGDATTGASCTNGAKDGDETDVDCGGATCGPCGNGKSCAARRDCVSLVCASAKCSGDLGCADGTREGFTSLATHPNIAACAGGWTLPGLLAAATKTPACNRLAGDDGTNPTGTGCNVADLCQAGWHVCATPSEVSTKAGLGGCAGAAPAGAFFVTRQSGAGLGQCGGAGANDIFGCGGAGAAPDAPTCAPLDRFSGDLCASLPTGWACGADGLNEANNVTKPTSDGGGVLCCRD